jgi:hypothetical protein
LGGFVAARARSVSLAILRFYPNFIAAGQTRVGKFRILGATFASRHRRLSTNPRWLNGIRAPTRGAPFWTISCKESQAKSGSGSILAVGQDGILRADWNSAQPALQANWPTARNRHRTETLRLSFRPSTKAKRLVTLAPTPASIHTMQLFANAPTRGIRD